MSKRNFSWPEFMDVIFIIPPVVNLALVAVRVTRSANYVSTQLFAASVAIGGRSKIARDLSEMDRSNPAQGRAPSGR